MLFRSVLAAVVVIDSPIRLSVTKHSTFLPTLLGDAETWSHQAVAATPSAENQ